MATQANTFTAGNYAGDRLRKLGELIQKAAMDVPPGPCASGASVTITFDNTANSFVVAGAGLPTQPTYLF